MKKCKKLLFLPYMTGKRESKRKCKHDADIKDVLTDDYYGENNYKYIIRADWRDIKFFNCYDCKINICTYCSFHYNYYTYPRLKMRTSIIHSYYSYDYLKDYPKYCIDCVENIELIEGKKEFLELI